MDTQQSTVPIPTVSIRHEPKTKCETTRRVDALVNLFRLLLLPHRRRPRSLHSRDPVEARRAHRMRQGRPLQNVRSNGGRLLRPRRQYGCRLCVLLRRRRQRHRRRLPLPSRAHVREIPSRVARLPSSSGGHVRQRRRRAPRLSCYSSTTWLSLVQPLPEGPRRRVPLGRRLCKLSPRVTATASSLCKPPPSCRRCHKPSAVNLEGCTLRQSAPGCH